MLKDKYKKEVSKKLKEKFGYKNDMEVPKVKLISINVGIRADNAKDSKFIETVESTLTQITGQKPVRTLAKKSIAGFKIREGMVVGVKVTLRGEKMWSFLDKLINVTLPRVRDFRGVPMNIVDNKGNLSLGFKEYISFPEIKSDEVERLHGLQVTVNTTADTKEEGLELLTLMGFPFQKAKA